VKSAEKERVFSARQRTHLFAFGLNLKAEMGYVHQSDVVKIAKNIPKATLHNVETTLLDLAPTTFRVNPEAVFCTVSG